MPSSRFRTGGLSVCALVLCGMTALMRESHGTEPGATPAAATREAHPLAGHWRIDFHPNQAIREYTIARDGRVSFVEFPDWKATLVGRGGAKAGYVLRFEGDPVDRVERLTLIADGRLLVEHYNPGTAFTDEGRPDQIGIGVSTR